MDFPAPAVERAMTYQQVIMRALAGTWTWLQAADVLGLDPRSLRRWRARYAQDGVTGLLDCPRRRPPAPPAPPPLLAPPVLPSPHPAPRAPPPFLRLFSSSFPPPPGRPPSPRRGRA